MFSCNSLWQFSRAVSTSFLISASTMRAMASASSSRSERSGVKCTALRRRTSRAATV